MSLSVYQLKPRFQQLLSPLVGALAAARISPNQLTLATAALMLAYGAGLALSAGPGGLGPPGAALSSADGLTPWARALWLGLPGVLLLRMALNALDGMLAVRTGQTSRLGALLNEVTDVVADLALYLPVALLPGVSAPLAVGAAVGAAVVEHAGLAALAAGSPRRFDGPMGKSDRAVAYGLVGLLAGLGAPAAWINGVLAGVAVLLAWTLVNRVRAGAAPPTP